MALSFDVAAKLSRESVAYAGSFIAGAVLCALALPPASTLLATLWWASILVIVRSDLTSFTIPDEATLAIAALGVVQAYLASDDRRWIDVAHAMQNGALAFSVFWIVKLGYRRWRGREGLGFGDVKLAGACAIWLDPPSQILALELAAASAALLTLLRGRRRDSLVPFGAFLAPAAWLVFVSHSWIAPP